MNPACTLAKWLAPAAALFALACALLAPAEAGSARPRRALAQNVNAPAGEANREPPADSVVRGRAVYEDTSRPVRRARVLLITDVSGRGEYSALTDARGEFAIPGVRAGSYYAFVDVPGVLSPIGFIGLEDLRVSSGAPDLGEARKFFDLIEVDGKQNVNVTVRARRGASVAGRVSYADGDPAVNVTVNLMRRGADGRVQRYLTGANIVSLSGMRTDDRGAFRLTGLPPGEYFVAVTESVEHGPQSGVAGPISEDIPNALRGLLGQHLLMTFHPSATGLKEAAPVRVGAGDERADIDISIPERALRTISGVVRSRRGGRPVARARVSITRRDDPLARGGVPPPSHYEGYETSPNATTTDDEGRWYLFEIPDGPYTVYVRPTEEYEPATGGANSSVTNSNLVAAANMNSAEYRPPRRKRPYAPARRDLEVSGDVSEFVVELPEGGRVAGTISVEGGETPRYSYVSVLSVGEGGAPEDAGMRTEMTEDGDRFAVEGLPAGSFILRPRLSGGDSDIYLKSITWNGKDLTHGPLELAEGASAEGVRVVFARGAATLRVNVSAADGKRPASGVVVYLVPADAAAGSPHASSNFCETGRTGSCPVTAPPGEYRVVAVRRPATPGAHEEEVGRRAARSPRVTLRAGETRELEVTAPDN